MALLVFFAELQLQYHLVHYKTPEKILHLNAFDLKFKFFNSTSNQCTTTCRMLIYFTNIHTTYCIQMLIVVLCTEMAYLFDVRVSCVKESYLTTALLDGTYFLTLPHKCFSPLLSSMLYNMIKVMLMSFLSFIRTHIQGLANRRSNFCDVPRIYK